MTIFRNRKGFVQQLAMLSVAAVSLLAFMSATAHAATPKVDYTCPNGNDCFFSGSNENGNATTVTASQYYDAGWQNIESNYRGSASNKSTYNLWTVNYSSDAWTCFSSNEKGYTFAAGWFYVNGSGGCQDCPPPLMGNPCPNPASPNRVDVVAATNTVVAKP